MRRAPERSDMSRIATLWRRFAETVAVVAFAVMFTGFVLQIGSRYVFNSPVAWTLEVCLIGYVWVVFWTSNILVSERQHIVFDVLYHLVSPARRRWLAVFITLSLAVVFGLALPGVLDYIWFLSNRHSMLLRIPMPLVFGAFPIFIVAVVVGALIRLWHLLRPGWERHL
jgi:TRAP-type C4-dicarboxylate transport system permease small subunit